ncbi:InlB B-repeat-containing protein [Candidatus Saccharibacteria bacterium]|nr:InlB B-repeat-containing protein [Candidatus Saccharibacteria bacterium]
MKKMMRVLVSVLVLCGVMVVIAPVDAQAKYVSESSQTINLSVRKKKYTVVFNANADQDTITGTMANQEFEDNIPQTLRKNAYERDNYIFKGWNTNADDVESGTAYADEQENVTFSGKSDGEVITLYAQWEYSPMPIVFESTNVCEFHGAVDGVPQPITGDGCDYKGLTYIDTGWQLYSADHYNKDFEIGFKIVEYNSSANPIQATFANSKYESGSDNSGNPGFVVRKTGTNNIEITQMINNVKVTKTFPANSITEVKLARVDGVLYYSINGGAFEFLQTVGEYYEGNVNVHNIPMWFGAAPTHDLDEEGHYIPTRYLVGKLSDIYIKVGQFENFRHTITFNANGEGATVTPTQKDVLGDSMAIGDLPTPVWTGHAFVGWYTADGERIHSDYAVTEDMELYAHWLDDSNVCEVNAGGNVIKKESLQACVNAAGTSGRAEITILMDLQTNIIVSAGQEIEFDLGEYELVGSANKSPVIENNGTIHIKGGTFKTSKEAAVINNRTTNSKAYISGGKIISTGIKQAVYNESGEVVISGDAYLSANAPDRATVHNLKNGKVTILGGTIISQRFVAVSNESTAQELTIGNKDGNIDATAPIIRGATYGVLADANINFYDGTLMGVTDAINNVAKIADNEGTLNTTGTETIDGETYKTLYNE